MNRLALLFFALGSCTPTPDARTTSSASRGASSSEAIETSTPKQITGEAPLQEGLVEFEGMVRGTKGGYDVRGVILDDDALPKALAGAQGSDPKDPDWLLGAMVRVKAELRKVTSTPPEGEIVQMRIGTWWNAIRVESAQVVKPAEVIEGALARSKGFFALQGRLISSDDLAWSLAPNGGREGDRVRLYGQSRTVVCGPDEQCLIEGSLPLFDVGRAIRLP